MYLPPAEGGGDRGQVLIGAVDRRPDTDLHQPVPASSVTGTTSGTAAYQRLEPGQVDPTSS